MSQPDPDTEVIELSVALSGLSITVRGSPARAAEFVRGLSDRGSPSASHNDPTLDLSAASLSSVAPSATESCSSIPGSFPLCPAHWLARGNCLSGSRIPGNQRVRRAWIAGCWAGAVLEERISSPNRSEAIELQNRFWCVVSSQGITCSRVLCSEL